MIRSCFYKFLQLKRTNYTDSTEKLLKVGIIGLPNSGKSSLVNCIVQKKVCAVSHIPHTTRISSNGVINFGNTQLVFTDTPGVVSFAEGNRLNLSKAHVRTPRRLEGSIDILTVLADVSRKKTRSYIDSTILEIMNSLKGVPIILVMNKVDLVRRKEELLSITTLLTENRQKDEWGYKPYGGSSLFKECFFTTATTGEGVDPYLDYLVSQAKPNNWEYSDNVHTDVSMEFQISEVFREKLLVLFGQEIPWQVQQETVLMESKGSAMQLHQYLMWPKKSQCRYVETKYELLLSECRKELEDVLECDIELNLIIKNKKNMVRKDYG